jgi:hypothetical protein
MCWLMQIREQSEHFLHGFQQLIKPEWIGMFNEQELQVHLPRPWAYIYAAQHIYVIS